MNNLTLTAIIILTLALIWAMANVLAKGVSVLVSLLGRWVLPPICGAILLSAGTLLWLRMPAGSWSRWGLQGLAPICVVGVILWTVAVLRRGGGHVGGDTRDGTCDVPGCSGTPVVAGWERSEPVTAYCHRHSKPRSMTPD